MLHMYVILAVRIYACGSMTKADYTMSTKYTPTMSLRPTRIRSSPSYPLGELPDGIDGSMSSGGRGSSSGVGGRLTSLLYYFVPCRAVPCTFRTACSSFDRNQPGIINGWGSDMQTLVTSTLCIKWVGSRQVS